MNNLHEVSMNDNMTISNVASIKLNGDFFAASTKKLETERDLVENDN